MKINNIDVKLVKQSSVSSPNVSVIIRCKNEEKGIETCIKSIVNQQMNRKVEIIIIDSGSTDNTLYIAQNYDVTIYTIPSNQFQFGSSINLGITLARGEYCMFVSAHAIPANNKWLINLLKPMEKDAMIAGTFSRQLYYSDSDFIQKRNIDETFGKSSKMYTISGGSFKQNLKNISFSNASSCIRKNIALKIPFKNVIASEDREWAYRAMKNGYKIVYVSKSEIFHVHNETPTQWYKRIYINSKALHEFASVKINWLEFLPLIVWKVLKDIKYCKKNKIKISNSILKQSIKYEYLYSKAHLKGSE